MMLIRSSYSLLGNEMLTATRLLNPTCSRLHTSTPTCKVIPKNAKGNSTAQRWLLRQLNDPYVKRARQEMYRARSAYKLLEIQEKVKLLQPGQGVIECGCCPGAWTQVIIKHINAVAPNDEKPITYDPDLPEGRVIGLDLLPTAPLHGAVLLANADCFLPKTWDTALQHLQPYPVDLVLSDIAPNATGVGSIDQEKIMELVYTVAKFAVRNGAPGSSLLCKVWSNNRLPKLIQDLSKFYESARILKPPCSRDNSAELYVYGQALREKKEPV